jgi:Lon protease-like protein
MPIKNRQLPLFPLNTVLFPGMTLPLQIFEPCYQQMLKDCLSSDPVFGAVFIREDLKVGRPAAPHEIGTTARIIGVEKKDPSLWHITTVGEERFRLHGILHERPYLVGEVEPFPLADVDAPEIETLAERGAALLAAYLQLLSKAIGAEIKLQRSLGDPALVAYLTAMLLQVTLPEKQRLLSVADLPSLLREEAVLLEGERKALTVMIHALETGGPPQHEGTPFSKN